MLPLPGDKGLAAYAAYQSVVDARVERQKALAFAVVAGACAPSVAQDVGVADGQPAPAGSTPQAEDLMEVLPCDEQAAHPSDPDRMAVGVAMEKIVPRLALQQCQRAAVDHPKVARFQFELGRAQEASGSLAEAIKSYQRAAAMGDRMAFHNLGISYADGNGVAVDLKIAEACLRRAMAAGLDENDELASIVFTPNGYSDPSFFAAIYNDQLPAAGLGGAGAYLVEFLSMFRNSDLPGCQQAVTTYAFARLASTGQLNLLGQFVQGLVNARRDYAPGDFGAAAQSGWEAGQATNRRIVMSVSNAREDAQTFYDRHGCDFPGSEAILSQFECGRGTIIAGAPDELT